MYASRISLKRKASDDGSTKTKKKKKIEPESTDSDPFGDKRDQREKEWAARFANINPGVNFPEAHWGDLNNEIHPIFNSLMSQPGFLPALRLASKHLQEPLLLPFWHALLGAPAVPLPLESEAFGTPIYNLSRKFSPLTPADVENTKFVLGAAAPHIQFLFSQGTKEGDLDQSYATTSRAHPNDETFRHLNVQERRAPGSGAIISLKFAFAAGLSDHSKTLLHEVAHAIYMFRTPRAFEVNSRDATIEPFFEDQTFAEVGHAMEKILFGGFTHIAYNWMNFASPSGLSTGKFPQMGHSILTVLPKGIVSFIRRPAHQRWESEYMIPMTMIQEQFTTLFWDTEVKMRGAAALQLPKGEGKAFLGLRNVNPDWNPTKEDRWSYDSSFERDAGPDKFILPGMKNFKGTQLHDRLFTKPAGSGQNFVMGQVYQYYQPETQASIRYFDQRGNQISGPSEYTEFISTELRAYPPIFTTKRHQIDRTRTKLVELDGTYYGN